MCPECRQTATLPLTDARRVTYAVIALLAVVASLAMLIQGDIPILGVIPALMLAALAIDLDVRKRYRAAQTRHQTATAEKAS